MLVTTRDAFRSGRNDESQSLLNALSKILFDIAEIDKICLPAIRQMLRYGTGCLGTIGSLTISALHYFQRFAFTIAVSSREFFLTLVASEVSPFWLDQIRATPEMIRDWRMEITDKWSTINMETFDHVSIA